MDFAKWVGELAKSLHNCAGYQSTDVVPNESGDFCLTLTRCGGVDRGDIHEFNIAQIADHKLVAVNGVVMLPVGDYVLNYILGKIDGRCDCEICSLEDEDAE